MSLPTATKDVSEHPAKTAVAAPVNKANKEADVDRKMRLYGVIQAFRLGRMPSNAQIDETLKYVVNNSPIDESKLSSEGRELTQDVRDIIETARLMVQRKNADELFQNFMWSTRHIDTSTVKKDPNEVIPVDGEKVAQDKDQASKHLRTLLNLLATNEEARKLLSDFSILGRDVLARGATHAASQIRPDQDRLQKVDESAPADSFVTAGGKKAGPNETPVAEASIPGVDGAVRHHPDGGVHVEKDGERYSVDEAKELTATRAQENADRAREQATRELQETQAEADQGELDTEEKKRSLKERMAGIRDGMLDRLPQEHKDKTKDKYNDGKRVLTEEYFPEERRDQFIYRGKKVIVECQRHDDYQESIRWLLTLVEEYAGHGRHIATHGKDAHGQITSDNSIQTSWDQLRTLLERFANNQSMDPIFDAINNLIDDARNDDEFRQWWGRVDSYTRDVLLEPGFVLEPRCNEEGRQLRESGRRFYDDKYKTHFDRLFNTVGDWFKAMADDPLNKRFGDDLARLTRDLLFDNEGSLKFKPDLWLDIRKHILPTLVEQVGYVPIPRIEYTDDQLDLVIENLTFQGRNIFPNVVSMNANNFIKFSPYNTIGDEAHHEFTFTFGQIQADMRDVAFYFSKKSGFPKLTDQGLADVLLGGEGLTATVHLASSSKDKSSVFKVKDVNVKIDTLKFSIRDSKHDTLYKTLKPLASGLVKKQIQKAAQDAIRTAFEYIDGQLVTVRDRYSEAKQSDEASRADALKSVFQRNKEQAEKKQSEAQSTASQRNAQFKVSAQRDQAIVNAGHDAGYSNKAQERADVAKQGQGWHSDAFSIV